VTRRADRDLPPKRGRLFGRALELAYTRGQVGYRSGELLVSASGISLDTFMEASAQGRIVPRSKLESVHAAAARIVEKTGVEPRTHEEINAYYSAQLPDARPPAPGWTQGENDA